MVAPLVAAVAPSVAGGLISAAGSLFSGKQSADFAEKSYKHRYQWQVKDLQKAGLNPMLSFSQGAPNVPQPQFPNAGESAVKGGTMASSAAMAAKLGEAQLTNLAFDSDLKNNQAQVAANTARGLDIDNELKAHQLPYGADAARLGIERLNTEVVNLGHIAQNSGLENLLKSVDVEYARLNKEQELALKSIETTYRQYMAQQARLGIPEAQANAAFWDKAGIGGVIAQKIKSLIPGIGNINVGGSKTINLPPRK